MLGSSLTLRRRFDGACGGRGGAAPGGNWWWHHLSRSSRRARSPLPPLALPPLAERFLGLAEVLGGAGGGGGIPPRVGDGQKAGGGGRCGGCWSGCPATKGAASCRDGALDCSGWGEILPPSADVGMSCVVSNGGSFVVFVVLAQTAGAAAVAGEEVRCRSGGGRFDDSPDAATAAAAAALSFGRRCGSIAADSTTHSLDSLVGGQLIQSNN